jgi:hypothetical protein
MHAQITVTKETNNFRGKTFLHLMRETSTGQWNKHSIRRNHEITASLRQPGSPGEGLSPCSSNASKTLIFIHLLLQLYKIENI